MVKNAVKRRRMLAVVVATTSVMSVALAACSPSGQGDPPNPAESSDGAAGATDSVEVPPLTVDLNTVTVDVRNYIADKQGYFEDEGVDVDVTCCSAANGIGSLTAGRIDIEVSSIGQGLAVAIQGQPVQLVYGNSSGAVGASMVGSLKIKTLDDLKALPEVRMGTYTPGSAAYAFAAVYCEQLELNCKIQNYSTPPLLTGALGGGFLDAVVGGYAAFASLVDAGQANLLIDQGDPEQLADFPQVLAVSNGYMGVADNLEKKRESVVRWLRAIDRAEAYLQDHTDEEVAEDIKDYPPYAGLTPEALVGIVKSIRSAADMMPQKERGLVSTEDWDLALETFNLYGINGFDPGDEAVSYDTFVDMSYYEAAVQ